jgi:hypothetical protein
MQPIAGGIIIAMILHGGWSFGAVRLWVGFVTLWLVWPIALLVHRGRSVLRVTVPILVSVLILWRGAWREYAISVPGAVGLPWGLSIYPRDLYAYFTARHAGRVEAEKDLGAGVLAVETYGMPCHASMHKSYANVIISRFARSQVT